MSKFWDQNNQSIQTQAPQQVEEQSMTEEELHQYVNQVSEGLPSEEELQDDEDADMAEVLTNANLRLEQGRLYQLLIEHDMFENMNADLKAIRNVTRELRRFARERMEIMLGMRQVNPQAQIVSSPFNEVEVIVLKTMAATFSKGKTVVESKPAQPVAPKKDSITPLSGKSLPAFASKGALSSPVPTQKFNPVSPTKPAAPQKAAPKPVSSEPRSLLTKPIDQMTPDELAVYEDEAAKRRGSKAALPAGYSGIPSSQELEMLYQNRISNMQANPANAAAGLMSLLQRKP